MTRRPRRRRRRRSTRIAVGTDIQRRIGVKTSRDEPLARFTTMRVGGPADLFATVRNAFELRALVRFARARAIAVCRPGAGERRRHQRSGVRGLVIQVRAEGSEVAGDRYIAEAGVPMARAATETQRAGLSGLEFGLAIPGTVGGAVWANAGRAWRGRGGRPRVGAGSWRATAPRPSSRRADLGLAYRDTRLKHRRRTRPPSWSSRRRSG